MSETQITSIEQIKVGDFVKFVDRDKSGKFSHVGEVVGIQKETKLLHPSFEMLTFEGTMGFRFPKEKGEVTPQNKETLENELYITNVKPKGWAKFKKDPSGFKDDLKEEEKVVPVKPLKDRVADLVAANSRKKEAALLKLAKKEIGGSDTKLSNYIKLALTKK